MIVIMEPCRNSAVRSLQTSAVPSAVRSLQTAYLLCSSGIISPEDETTVAHLVAEIFIGLAFLLYKKAYCVVFVTYFKVIYTLCK